MSSTIGISNATTVRDQRETQRRLGEHRSWEVMNLRWGISAFGPFGVINLHPHKDALLEAPSFYTPVYCQKASLACLAPKQQRVCCEPVFASNWGKFSYFYSDALVEQQSHAIVLRNWRRTGRQVLRCLCHAHLWNSFTNFWNAATETSRGLCFDRSEQHLRRPLKKAAVLVAFWASPVVNEL